MLSILDTSRNAPLFQLDLLCVADSSVVQVYQEGKWSYSSLPELLSGEWYCANKGGIPDAYLKKLLSVSFHFLLSTSLKSLGSLTPSLENTHQTHVKMLKFLFMGRSVHSLLFLCSDLDLEVFLEVFTTGGLDFSCSFI